MTVTLSNHLTDLADRVRAANDAVLVSKRTTIEKALEAGHLLIEAKERCKHGEWLPFLDRAGVHQRTSQRFMTLAASGLEIRHVSDLGGIRAALEHIAGVRKEAEERERDTELRAEIMVVEIEIAAQNVEIAELEEQLSRLKARIKFFEDHKVLYDKGSWQAVFDLDEERIRNLERQKEDIQADIRSLNGSVAYWKKQALALGYVSPNEQQSNEELAAEPF